MGLREELLAIPPGDAKALSEQMKADRIPVTADATYEQRIDWFREQLEFPILRQLFDAHVEIFVRLEGRLPEKYIDLAVSAAGTALLGVKAVANKQVFRGLETPPDIE